MDGLMESQAFAYGVAVGIGIHQQKVVEAHRQKEPLVISDTLYYVQSGRERLEEVLDRICR